MQFRDSDSCGAWKWVHGMNGVTLVICSKRPHGGEREHYDADKEIAFTDSDGR